ncbi:hypothetical protein [Paramaledivibacter caminithermalis]|uniref:Uncharacterized protein n=1 Tax=Paramaledivibacter caminithermalis (strain DSM 15212 / CIP 107654 / DViRD3) TaxID=1121301 RepID=A0A1M6T156_PARC5|nr:hypothetical protein [Paramaledivibacter caminithermalis]SHK50649.1 hypothetical protein SAMN02745912_03516 [Paramaledivibacter caminithermalis DSM 15212]
MKSMKKVSLVLCSIIILCILFSSTAIALSAYDYGYVFGFDYGDGVNTIAIAQQESMYLRNLGFTVYCNTDVSADFAIGNSPNTNRPRIDSGVFVTNGHSGPRCYQFYGKSKSTYLTAKKSGGSYYKFDDISMSNCKAALFYGCKTASKDRSTDYGVLTDEAVDNGASCAFGWNKSVNTDTATKFRERMFYFIRYGYTIGDAAANAKSEMPWFDATRDYRISGDSSTKLTTGAKFASARVSQFLLSPAEISEYREVKTEGSNKIHVKYINEFATTDYYETDKDNKIISGKNDFNIQEKNKLLKKVTKIKTYDIAIPEKIISGGLSYKKVKVIHDFKLIAKIENETRFLRVINTEYENENGLCYLNTQVIDLETGNEIPYMSLLSK